MDPTSRSSPRRPATAAPVPHRGSARGPDRPGPPGTALFLTGPSAAGKTTVGLRLQELLPEPWLFYEVDRCQPRTSPKRPKGFEPYDVERRFSWALLASAHAYLAAGFSAIIEMDLADRWRQRYLTEIFAGVRTSRVVLTCDARTHEQHLASRGTEGPTDWARGHLLDTDWTAVPADLVVATDGSTADETADRILRWLRTRSFSVQKED